MSRTVDIDCPDGSFIIGGYVTLIGENPPILSGTKGVNIDSLICKNPLTKAVTEVKAPRQITPARDDDINLNLNQRIKLNECENGISMLFSYYDSNSQLNPSQKYGIRYICSSGVSGNNIGKTEIGGSLSEYGLDKPLPEPIPPSYVFQGTSGGVDFISCTTDPFQIQGSLTGLTIDSDRRNIDRNTVVTNYNKSLNKCKNYPISNNKL